MASSSLTVANIHAGYGAVRVLEDVSLNVAVLIALQAEAKAIVFDFVKPLGRRGHNFTRGRQAKLKSKHAGKIGISAGYCDSLNGPGAGGAAEHRSRQPLGRGFPPARGRLGDFFRRRYGIDAARTCLVPSAISGSPSCSLASDSI